jgi:quercetin dioxygenase-like cupin family protein
LNPAWAAGGERFELKQGDVLSSQGNQVHSYGNESQDNSVLFSVVTLAPV